MLASSAIRLSSIGVFRAFARSVVISVALTSLAAIAADDTATAPADKSAAATEEAKKADEAKPDETKPARPAKAWLGLESQVLTRELATALDVEGKRGVRLTQILPDSPAEQAGLKTGDLLFKLDGTVIAASTLADQELFANMIREYKVGSAVELEGLRAGQPLKLNAKLGTQPKPNSDLETYKDERFEFTARELSLNEAVVARLKSPEDGVRIATVQSAGWAALAGVAGGDILLAVDGQPVKSVAQLKQTMKNMAESKPRRVVFYVKRGIYTEYFELEPKW